MFEIFELALMRRALLAALMIGFTNGFVSAFVVLHRSPLKLGALSHSVFPGIAAVVLLLGLSTVGVYFGALVAAALVGLGAVFFARRAMVGEETVLAVLMTGAFAAGVMMLTRYEGAGGLEDWLLGNIVGMSDSDLWMSYGVGALAVLVLAILRRPILVTLFEPDIAATLGVRTQVLNYGLFALLILVLVTTLQAVGAILALGFIVTPAAAVRQLVGSVRGLFLWSGVVGATGAGLGFLGAVIFDQPIGAFMVVVLTVLFLIAVLIRRLREGVVRKRHRH
ncbi:metal ABC transporter permease [Roseibacillus ishigakijimensis]|uniref:High-affinity zinc uptake system membrane protein ZnuB n=1 Tax=Roseibacillus ishigakijimensis TaxID=454146 RepID=A0A934RTN1_9BACT|nr:metal ABC transporter permease [Roseibacillus ishigakijimensis]MBK1835228.1 metal ABC transporter permease [Roseibacillus ishigakijimensis]